MCFSCDKCGGCHDPGCKRPPGLHREQGAGSVCDSCHTAEEDKQQSAEEEEQVPAEADVRG
tara:strand:- start:772 stop:954 length:183 start_codon:yes stop_codon:yes gene_type:complete